MQTLSLTPTGNHLITLASVEALRMEVDLLDIIRPGDFSAVTNGFSFVFDRANPTQNLTRHGVAIFLDRKVDLGRATAHLAHELVHFIMQDVPNPYDLNHTESALETIISTIEGRGGEVDASMVECQVLVELTQGLFQDPYCQAMSDAAGNIDREKVVASYYRMGEHYQDFVEQLRAEGFSEDDLPHLSSEDSQLFLNLGEADLPYPVAALEEYQRQREQVCAKHRERLSFMDSTSPVYLRAHSLIENYCL